MEAWTGFDLDGTLAEYTTWQGEEHIGKPIEPMVDLVRELVAHGYKVKIFTARVGPGCDVDKALPPIEAWCLEHIGQVLPVTATKDFGMVDMYDDRCHRVRTNTGEILA